MKQTWFLILLDAMLTVAAFLVSLLLRFEFNFVGYFLRGLWPLILVGAFAQPLTLYFSGVYKQIWRYATTRDFLRIGIAIVISSVIISISAYSLYPRFVFTIPRSILVMEALVSMIFLGGLRVVIRQLERFPGDILWNRIKLGPAQRVLIVGGGSAGVSLIRELLGNPQLGLRPVAIMDDDPRKIDKKVHGISISGPIVNLPVVAKDEKIDAVIIAIPSAPQQTIDNIKSVCHNLQLPYSTMPSLTSFLKPGDEPLPANQMKLPMSLPDITGEEIEAVVRVMQSRNLSIGSQTMAFEKFAAMQANASHAVAVINGTAAMHMCMVAGQISPGDEVITTPFSFIASANCILYTGATPIFVDIDPISLNIDTKLIEAAISPRTKAIIAVHVFGQPADMDPLLDIANRHNLLLIEDACEAIGAEYKGQRVGALGKAGAFAFYPNKQMTTGEGAVLVTNDDQWAELFRSLRNQGRDQFDGWLNHSRLGYNYRISEMNAAIGVVQMRRLNDLLMMRDRVAREYELRLKNIEGVSPLQIVPTTTRMSWFVYTVRFDEHINRNRVLENMAQRGIPTRPYFTPIHLQPFYYQRYGFKAGDFPKAEEAGSSIIALPFYATMKIQEVEVVCNSLAEVINSLDN